MLQISKNFRLQETSAALAANRSFFGCCARPSAGACCDRSFRSMNHDWFASTSQLWFIQLRFIHASASCCRIVSSCVSAPDAGDSIVLYVLSSSNCLCCAHGASTAHTGAPPSRGHIAQSDWHHHLAHFRVRSGSKKFIRYPVSGTR